MARKTQAVYDLVREVLEALPHPYGEDITEDVFVAIERNPQWLLRYRAIGVDLKEQWIVNNWIGKYVKEITEMRTGREVSSSRSDLITGYRKLN